MAAEIAPKDEPQFPEAIAAMRAVMARQSFTFADVWRAGDAAIGLPANRHVTCYRWADRLLQKAKRTGSIRLIPSPKGIGRPVWSAIAKATGAA